MKKIIIVGATSGLGLATARIFTSKGWRVGAAGRRVEHLNALKEEYPNQVEVEQIDITHENATEKLHLLIDKLSGMDVFFLSSGIGKQNRMLNPDIELATVRTNVEGFTRLVTAAYHYFSKEKKGHIAVISSIAGTKGLGSAPSYSATKRFQNIYIEALSQLSAMEKINIRFTDIKPGFVNTDLLSDGSNYPLVLKPEQVATTIVRAIIKQKRHVIIDWKYRVLVFFWKLIPSCLWERLRFIHTKSTRPSY